MTAFPKQVSYHGKRSYLDKDSRNVAKGGFVAGGEGAEGTNTGGDIVLPGIPGVAAYFDDFLGDTGATQWVFVTGDTGTVSKFSHVTGTNGVGRILTEVTPLNVPGETFAITHGLMLQWKPNQGPSGDLGDFGFAARVKFESVSRTVKRQHVFIGLADTGGAEHPAYDTGGGIISPATDLIGFMFSPGGDTGWSLVSSQGGTDQLAVPVEGPTANVYDTLGFIIRRGSGDTGGTAYFFRNGKQIGKINNPITGTVALTPWLGFWCQDTGQRYLDIDYVNIYAPRDTGL